jgi:hypothetical protein
MSRSLPAALDTEFNADELQPFQALELEFSDGVVRFWTGYGDLNADGKDWQAIGEILGISPNSETADLMAQGMSFTLGGLDTAVISAILNENYKMRPCALYIGALGSDGQPVSSLFQTFSGRIDTIDIQEDGQTCTIQINAENRLIDLNRPRLRKITDAEQKLRYPNDDSLAQVALLADKQLDWGK